MAEEEKQPARTNARTEPVAIRATLSGEAYQRAGRWWWRVRLPGEDKTRARPLKAPGAKAATCDLEAAEKIAFEMWEQAVRQEGSRQSVLDGTEKVEKLKAQFLDKVRHLTEICETATARAEAEARARAEIEARWNATLRPAGPGTQDAMRRTEDGGQRTTPMNPRTSDSLPVPAETGFCECCGAADVPVTDLEQIDSSQLLCPDCLNALRADASRVEADAMAENPPRGL